MQVGMQLSLYRQDMVYSPSDAFLLSMLMSTSCPHILPMSMPTTFVHIPFHVHHVHCLHCPQFKCLRLFSVFPSVEYRQLRHKVYLSVAILPSCPGRRMPTMPSSMFFDHIYHISHVVPCSLCIFSCPTVSAWPCFLSHCVSWLLCP